MSRPNLRVQLNNQDFSSLPCKPTLLGIDHSKLRLGFAIAILDTKTTHPKTILKRSKIAQDAKEVQKMVNAFDVDAMVFGWPLEADGKEGPRCQSVWDYSQELKNYIAMPIFFEDERLTSFDSDGDDQAAVLILESFISRFNKAKRSGQTP